MFVVHREVPLCALLAERSAVEIFTMTHGAIYPVRLLKNGGFESNCGDLSYAEDVIPKSIPDYFPLIIVLGKIC